MGLTITDIRLDLSSYCGEGCNFCPFHGDEGSIINGEYIPLENYIRLAEDLNEVNLHPKIRLVGSGEPTTYPHFTELVEVFKKNKHSLKLITNGQRLLKLSNVVASSIDSLIVSVHGNEKTHNALTHRANSYANLMNGISAVKSISPNMDMTMHFVITPDNYEQMLEHVYTAKNLGIKPRFQHLVFTEANKKLGKFDMNILKKLISNIHQEDSNIKFVPELNDSQLDYYYNTNNPYIRTPHQCKRILTDISIRYDGKAIMCDNRFIGDIAKESIVDIIYGKLRSEFVKNRTNEAASEKGLPNTCSRCCYN